MSSAPGTARLVAVGGPLRGRVFEVGNGIGLGRSADNGVVVDHPLVSAHHARIVREGDDYVIEDLGSRNGTSLAGQPVREPERLGALDVVDLAGATELVFQIRRPESAWAGRSAKETSKVTPVRVPTASGPRRSPFAPPDPSSPAAPVKPVVGVDRDERYRTEIGDEPVALPAGLAPPADAGRPETRIGDEPVVLPSALARPPASPTPSPPPRSPSPTPPPSPPSAPSPSARLVLWIEHGDGRRRRVLLRPGELLVGRGDDCDVAIDDPTLSRRHARLRVEGRVVTLADLGSTNHTFLEDHALEHEREVEIRPGARLRFGAVPARLATTEEETRR